MRGRTDYRLAKRAVVRQVTIGALPPAAVCDAAPPGTCYGLGNWGDVSGPLPMRGHGGFMPGYWSFFRYSAAQGFGNTPAEEATGENISFAEWMGAALPICAAMFVALCAVLRESVENPRFRDGDEAPARAREPPLDDRFERRGVDVVKLVAPLAAGLDQPRGLHERVGRGRADERPATLPQVLAERRRFGADTERQQRRDHESAHNRIRHWSPEHGRRDRDHAEDRGGRGGDDDDPADAPATGTSADRSSILVVPRTVSPGSRCFAAGDSAQAIVLSNDRGN